VRERVKGFTTFEARAVFGRFFVTSFVNCVLDSSVLVSLCNCVRGLCPIFRTPNTSQCVAVEASLRPTGDARNVHQLGKLAEGQARRWLLGGGRWSSCSGEQEVRPGQHVGVGV
jgi:hypothetical protein